ASRKASSSPSSIPARTVPTVAASRCSYRSCRATEVRRAQAHSDRGKDGADHFLLHDLVLVDCHVADTGDLIHVDVGELAVQLLGSRHRRPDSVADVEVDIATDTP